MSALAEIGKYKRLAELFVFAMKVDPYISAATNNEAINCLLDYGITERQAEKFINEAFKKHERGMLRSVDQTLKDISTCFRHRDHSFILAQLQDIIESGSVSENSQAFFDKCCDHLHHEE